MKRIVIITIIFGAVALVAAFFVSRSQQGDNDDQLPQSNISPTASILPQPRFPSNPLLPSPSYSVDAVVDTFPKTLPLYGAGQPANLQTEAERIAQIFNIRSAPIIDKAYDGTYYMWSTSPGLSVGPDGSQINYSALAPTSNPLPPDDAGFIDAATQLVSAITQKYNMKPSSILYFAPGASDLNFVERNKATAIQVNFTAVLGDLPLFAGDPKVSETVVRFNANKVLTYYSGYLFPQFVESSTTPVISLQVAETRLLGGQGALLSALSQADINAHDTKWYQFSLVKITQVSLAYYFDFSSKTLSPVYVFVGETTDRTTGNKVNTITAVSAVP